MMAYLTRLRAWFVLKADTVQARLLLGFLSFAESSVSFIPPDPFLVAMVFAHKHRWFAFASIAAITSIAGAVFGYVVGAALYETLGVRIIAFYHLGEYMQQATELIHEGIFLFTLTAAFTPIPFKVAVLAAGFTKAHFIPFIVATVVGRYARYLLVAYVAKVFGDNAAHFMRRFWWYTTVVGVALVVGFSTYYFFW